MADETFATALADSGVTAAAQPKPAAPAKPDKGGFLWGTGRRKAAIARVRVKTGSGKFEVNGKPYDQYFSELRDRDAVTSPLKLTKTEGSLDVFVNAHGGGYMGQAGAVMLGLARALLRHDPSLEPILRDNDLLTRDAREVERKKYGQPGARRRFQFSKR
jgi:small subunit ribosomal protein S9